MSPGSEYSFTSLTQFRQWGEELFKLSREIVRIQLQVFKKGKRPETIGNGSVEPTETHVEQAKIWVVFNEIVRNGSGEAGLGQDQRVKTWAFEQSLQCPFYREAIDLEVLEVRQECQFSW